MSACSPRRRTDPDGIIEEHIASHPELTAHPSDPKAVTAAEPGTPRQSVWCPIRDADGSVCNRPAGHTAPCRFVEPYPAPSTGGEDVEFMADAYKAMAGERAAVIATPDRAPGLREAALALVAIEESVSVHTSDCSMTYEIPFPCDCAVPSLIAALRAALAEPAEVTRFEVIDRRILGKGRAFVAHDIAVELSYQDDGRTLKVFVTDRATSRSTRQ